MTKLKGCHKTDHNFKNGNLGVNKALKNVLWKKKNLTFGEVYTKVTERVRRCEQVCPSFLPQILK